MTTDIRTMKEVEIGGYTVAVGRQKKNQDIYDAAVIEEPNNPLSQMVEAAFGKKTQKRSKVRDGPIVSHGSMYIAVGMAVEEYLDSFLEEEELYN